MYNGERGLIDWMVIYAAFNSTSVVSRRQFKLFMSFLGFTSTRLGLWSVLPKDTPTKQPRGSSAAQTEDPWITSQTLYQWATQDPHGERGMNPDYHQSSERILAKQIIKQATSCSQVLYATKQAIYWPWLLVTSIFSFTNIVVLFQEHIHFWKKNFIFIYTFNPFPND